MNVLRSGLLGCLATARRSAAVAALVTFLAVCPPSFGQAVPEGNAYLKMNTTSDLDLHGYFPWGTHVWYGAKEGEPANLTRGEYLTHDANVQAGTSTVGAVERIYFPAHDGQYQFRVHNFQDRGNGNNPYVLQVFFGHQMYNEVGNLGGTGSQNSYYYTFQRQGNQLSRVGQTPMPDRAPTTLTQAQLVAMTGSLTAAAQETRLAQQGARAYQVAGPVSADGGSLVRTTLASFINPPPNQFGAELVRSLAGRPTATVQTAVSYLASNLSVIREGTELVRGTAGALLNEAIPYLGTTINVGIDINASKPDDLANVLVRDGVKVAAGLAAGALVGTSAPVWVAVGVPVLAGYGAGKLYDYAAPKVTEWAQDAGTDIKAGFNTVMNLFSGASPNPFSPNSASNPSRDWRWSSWSGW